MIEVYPPVHSRYVRRRAARCACHALHATAAEALARPDPPSSRALESANGARGFRTWPSGWSASIARSRRRPSRTRPGPPGGRAERAPPEPDAPGAAPAVQRAAPPAVAPSDPRPLDINRASLDELARLPGVGPGLARRIVDERERRGRFESPDALRYVLGMGPKKLAAIRELITVSE